jgi:hypothetical protein
MVNRGLRPHRDRVELGAIALAQKRAVAPEPDQRAADVACWLIPELFEVGFSLASSASILDEPARSEITAAVDRLDEIIALLRAAGRDPA